MKKRKAKLRTRSQQIGEVGESIFRTWASERELSPTKPEYDYGIDFFCSVFRQTDTQIEEITGYVLAVQVRSTSVEDNQRITMDRTDAETALRIDNPYALIGVDTITKKVSFRFMDEAFVEELHTFLRSENNSHSWLLADLENGEDDFTRLLVEACRPAY